MSDQNMKSYKVWDMPTRLFHGINLLSIIVLLAVGLVIFNGGSFGIKGEGKTLLKTIHVYAGYVFAINLILRLLWGFFGNRYARYNALLPMGAGYIAKLKAYLVAEKSGKPQYYLGHNPLARIALTVMIIVLISQAATGLVLAGTDIYFPPFGGWIAEWVAASGVDPSTLVPGTRDMVDEAAFKEMRAFRSPYIDLHVYGMYTLLVLIPLHIFASIRTDSKTGGGLISALFTGKKVYPSEPEDN